MRFLVKVRVDGSKLHEFAQKLQKNELDRSLIRSETICLRSDPALGYSVWEAEDRRSFDKVFSAWVRFYAESEIEEVIAPDEAMRELSKSGTADLVDMNKLPRDRGAWP